MGKVLLVGSSEIGEVMTLARRAELRRGMVRDSVEVSEPKTEAAVRASLHSTSPAEEALKSYLLETAVSKSQQAW